MLLPKWIVASGASREVPGTRRGIVLRSKCGLTYTGWFFCIMYICFASFLLAGCGDEESTGAGNKEEELPEPGKWKVTGTGKGENDVDARISFVLVVSEDQKSLSVDGEVAVFFENWSGGPVVVLVGRPYEIFVELTASSFSHNHYVYFALEGEFDSKTTARGMWEYTNKDPFGTTTVLFKGEWAASYIEPQTDNDVEGD